jgi:hypothetical protein
MVMCCACVCGVGDWTQDHTHARQVLYQYAEYMALMIMLFWIWKEKLRNVHDIPETFNYIISIWIFK